ncbi:MAG: glycosyltransferase [Erythrobacter sp.]|jgi:glycosyltransferase involved in cell wall biosynthesis|nr:glycosyltransferase [Erythrobacter sp.]
MSAEHRPRILPRILHVSADFPDPVEPFKTPVIKRLLELTQGAFEHEVISLNRDAPDPLSFAASLLRRPRGGPVCQTDEQPFKYGLAMTYAAPGRGLWHRTMLEQLGEAIAAHIAGMAQPPQLLVGHKLTVEGIAVHRAAQLMGLPYALTIQGNTDRKILAARPDLRSHFRKVLHGARSVVAFSPTARAGVQEALGPPPAGIGLLPCPLDDDRVLAPRAGGNGLISVFHLKNHRVKNLDILAQAASAMERDDARCVVTIIGGGNAAERKRCETIAGSDGALHFAGPLERGDLRRRMNAASALVMPSRRESFGLVFIEALFSGLPIIYPAGTAVDGYFDDCPFALRVDATSSEAIRQAMEQALHHEQPMKAALAEWQSSPAARRFTRPAIGNQYSTSLTAALGPGR